jgi:thioredoxin reductase
MSEASSDNGPGGESHRQRIGRHLIEVATKWEVVVKGHGDSAIDVASARDSVAAAQLLYQYDLGRPPLSEEEALLALMEHARKVEADRFQFAKELLGDKIRAMTDEEKAAFFQKCTTSTRGFYDIAREMLASQSEEKETNGRTPASEGEDAATPAGGARDPGEPTS